MRSSRCSCPGCSTGRVAREPRRREHTGQAAVSSCWRRSAHSTLGLAAEPSCARVGGAGVWLPLLHTHGLLPLALALALHPGRTHNGGQRDLRLGQQRVRQAGRRGRDGGHRPHGAARRAAVALRGRRRERAHVRGADRERRAVPVGRRVPGRHGRAAARAAARADAAADADPLRRAGAPAAPPPRPDPSPDPRRAPRRGART